MGFTVSQLLQRYMSALEAPADPVAREFALIAIKDALEDPDLPGFREALSGYFDDRIQAKDKRYISPPGEIPFDTFPEIIETMQLLIEWPCPNW